MAAIREQADGLAALQRLGLTPLEAEAYAFLLEESPATGYRVAQGLGRPFGSVYKTLESLEGKGAVLAAEEGDNRIFRAVRIGELLRRFTRDFDAQRRAALQAFRGRAPARADDRVYEVRSAEQFFERARDMLRRAKQFALASACPRPMAELRDDLVAAAQRGLDVGVKVYADVDAPGVRVVRDPRGVRAVESGPGEWVWLTIDGRELAIALLAHGGGEFHQGFWSANALLAWNTYTGLSSDLVLAAARNRLNAGGGADDLRAAFDELAPFETPRSFGKLLLRKRFRRAGRVKR
jgi:sugar-specific transcriptional regulator TrmB